MLEMNSKTLSKGHAYTVVHCEQKAQDVMYSNKATIFSRNVASTECLTLSECVSRAHSKKPIELTERALRLTLDNRHSSGFSYWK
jgi:hypothetical protein